MLDLLKRAVQRLLIHAVPFEGSDDPRLLSRRNSRCSGAPAPSGGQDLLQSAAAAVADVLARVFSHGLRPRVGGEGSEDLWDLIQVASIASRDAARIAEAELSIAAPRPQPGCEGARSSGGRQALPTALPSCGLLLALVRTGLPHVTTSAGRARCVFA